MTDDDMTATDQLQTEPDSSPEEEPTEVWTYIGREITWNRAKNWKPEINYVWMRPNGHISTWKKNPASAATPGSRYRMTLAPSPGDGLVSIYTSGTKMPRYVGAIEDPNERRVLVIKDRAAADEYEGYRKTIEKQKGSDYEDVIVSLRDAYRRITPSQRGVFIARLVYEITRG